MAENLAAAPVFSFRSDDDLCNYGIHYSELPTVEFLTNHLGVYRRTAARLNDSGIWFDALTFRYAQDRGQMTEEEEKIVQIFLPHFSKAVELTRPFQILKAEFQGVLSALDRFHVGVLLLNAHGTVVVKNAEAKRILGEKGGLATDPLGQLRACKDKDQSSLAVK